MKTIPLTQDKFTIVDDEDFDSLSKHKWYAAKRGYGFYAQRQSKLITNIQIHRVVLGAKKGEEVDHMNGDTLDNRKSNLRLVNRSQNEWNRGKQKNNTTGYKGVICRDGVFIARIRVFGKLINLGSFRSKEEAAEAYNEGAKEYHGEYAYLNTI